MPFVDPTPSIEQRLREELAPMQQALGEASDQAERRKIRRAMTRREQEIRSALSGPGTVW